MSPPFKCKDCSKAFKTQTTLLNHLALHQKLKPFECPFCEKRFISKSGMLHHIEKTCPKKNPIQNCVIQASIQTSRINTSNVELSIPENEIVEVALSDESNPKNHSEDQLFSVHTIDSTDDRIQVREIFISDTGIVTNLPIFNNYDESDEVYTHKSTLIQITEIGDSSDDLSQKVDMYMDTLNKSDTQNRKLDNAYDSAEKFDRTDDNKFKCKLCDKIFTKKFSFNRHYGTHDNSSYKCEKCQKEYAREDTLRRHYMTSCGNSKMKKRHHIPPLGKVFECDRCNAKFNRKDVLAGHIIRCENKQTYECAHCGYKCDWKSGLVAHIKKHKSNKLQQILDKYKDVPKNIRCPLCEILFARRKHALKHIEDTHCVPIKSEILHFDSLDAFYKWKTTMENTTITNFPKSHCDKRGANNIHEFHCHRSGCYQPKAEGRLRRLKIRGSKRLNRLCPAKICVHENKETAECRVLFTGIHLGHKINDVSELGYIAKGKGLMNANVATQEENEYFGLMDDVDDGTDNEEKLVSFTVSDELARIPCGSNEDFDAVEEFLAQHPDCLVYFKKLDELCGLFPLLGLDDTIIVYMNVAQRRMILKHAHMCVAMVGTVGIYDQFILHTLLVMDNHHDAFPVAFAISNRNDDVIVEVFLTCVREKLGILTTHTFISDMQRVYYDSWCKIMEVPPVRLLNLAHVFESWRKVAKKIRNLELRRIIVQRLQDMSMLCSEKEFEESLRELLADENPELESFYATFRKNFLPTTKLWAYCYRLAVDPLCNVHVDTFNSHTRFMGREFAKVPNLGSSLKLVDGYVRSESTKVDMKEIKGTVSARLRALRKRHDQLDKDDTEMCIMESNVDQGWYISVVTKNDVNQVYHLKEVESTCYDCRLYCDKCDASMHKYVCSCPDYVLKGHMCVHVHALCVFTNALSKDDDNLLETTESEENDQIVEDFKRRIQIFEPTNEQLSEEIFSDIKFTTIV